MAKKTIVTVEKTEGKQKQIAELRKNMEKDFGEGSIIGANSKPKFHDFIPTGSIGLDKAIGIGGIPRGRVIEIFGPESSGKTTLATHIMIEAQKLNEEAYVGIVDVEHAFVTSYAEQMGIDVDRLEISQPDWGEQALEITRKMVESGLFDVIVVDSVSALVPKSELEGEIGDQKMALQARMMSQAMRILCASVSKSNCCLIFINQLRTNIGGYGSPDVTSGGNALKFYSSVRLDIRRSFTLENSMIVDGEKVGNMTTVRVIKNKVAPPFRKCVFNIVYGEGIDKFGEIIDAAIESGIIQKGGSWFKYNDYSLGQGRESVRQLLKDNLDMYDEIKKKVEDTFIPKEFAPTQEDLKLNE